MLLRERIRKPERRIEEMDESNRLSNPMYERMCKILEFMENHPESVSEEDISKLKRIYSLLCNAIGISEHTKWRVKWKLEKWHDENDKLQGKSPDEIVYDSGNLVLDGGANEMLKVITGTFGGRPYSSANAYIFVGNNSTAESLSQTGVLATGSNRAYAVMDSGYPVVIGRDMIFQSSFGPKNANFRWMEMAITNGPLSNAVAMNRKVSQQMGTKDGGIWTLNITVSLDSE